MKRWLRERLEDPTDARFRMPEDENTPKPEVEDAMVVSDAAEDEKGFDAVDDAASANGWSSASLPFVR